MKWLCFLLVLVALLATGTSHGGRQPWEQDTKSLVELMNTISKNYTFAVNKSLPPYGTCAPANIAVRREWENLTRQERINYIQAVRCLQSKPGKMDPKIAPGAHTRYDDYVVTHINQTLFVHGTGRFLPWHRQMVAHFEQALREECGYKDYQPYWDWSKYALNAENSTIFSGRADSLGGDGDFKPHGDINWVLPGGPPPRPVINRPPGTGGGCIHGTEGDASPFASVNVTLGPNLINAWPGASGLDNNPRCLQRDFKFDILEQTASYRNVTQLLLDSPTIKIFHARTEVGPTVHAGPHGFMGGDMGDLFSSVNDPTWWLHHASVDRMWAIWQSRDMEVRRFAMDGTHTFFDYPKSANVTLDDLLYFDVVAGPIQIKEVMSTFERALCYMYV